MIQELSLVDGYDRQKAVALFDGFEFLVLGNLRGERLTTLKNFENGYATNSPVAVSITVPRISFTSGVQALSIKVRLEYFKSNKSPNRSVRTSFGFVA